MVRVIEETEYLVLYDEGYYWVIEDKLLKDFPIVYRGETKTDMHIITEFVELHDGTIRVARAWYEKDKCHLQQALSTFRAWAKRQQEEIRKMKVMQELLANYERRYGSY